MSLLKIFLLRSRGWLAIATFAGFVSGMSTTALIAVVNMMIRRHGTDVHAFLLLFVPLCLIRLASGLVAHALLVSLSQQAVHDLRVGLSKKIVAAPLRQLELLGASRLTTAFSDDILNAATAVINLPYLFVNMVVLIGCFTYLGWLSWPTLIGIGACVAVGAASYLVATTWAHRHLQQGRREQEQLFQHFRNVIAGAKELKLHAQRRVEFMTGSLGFTADQVRQHNTAGIGLYSAAANWSRLLFFVYVGLLLVWTGNTHSPTELATCIIVVLYMMAPLEAILNALPVMAQANVALGKVEALQDELGREAIDAAGGSSDQVEAEWKELELADVIYSYDNKERAPTFALGPINLVLRPGEITFLVGGNGSGKTTLGKVIVGLYGPDSGEILLDDEALSRVGQQERRAMCSAVFNDFCLFKELPGLSDDQISLADRYLRMLKLDHKVKVADRRLSTIDLSQGQRKRLALLVALLEDRSLYLFDEWAAEQEPEFKQIFYGRIVPELSRRGKAVVVITHDDRFFDLADHLIKLEDGKVCAVHASPIENGGSAFLKAVKLGRRLDAKAL